VQGDPADETTLRAAGIGRAAAVYACTSKGTSNADIAVLTGQIPRAAKRTLSAYVLVPNAELGVGLQARRIGMSTNPRLQLVFFAIDDIAAGRLFEQYPLTRAAGGPAQIVISGFGPFGQAVLRETARQSARTGRSRAEVHQPRGRVPFPARAPAVDARAGASRLDLRTAPR
jgi:hypothetical protein